ncbi:MAG: hypothetical protein HY661_10260 [Betaproteobacteria bacterium]|nr:hypothetical protein [Betaproteobacteria bacterium]
MTETAIGMEIRRGSAARIIAGSLVLVRMMPKVLRGSALLVLTIGARRRPDGLERQYQHQEDEEDPIEHGQQCIRYGSAAQCGISLPFNCGSPALAAIEKRTTLNLPQS